MPQASGETQEAELGRLCSLRGRGMEAGRSLQPPEGTRCGADVTCAQGETVPTRCRASDFAVGDRVLHRPPTPAACAPPCPEELRAEMGPRSLYTAPDDVPAPSCGSARLPYLPSLRGSHG